MSTNTTANTDTSNAAPKIKIEPSDDFKGEVAQLVTQQVKDLLAGEFQGQWVEDVATVVRNEITKAKEAEQTTTIQKAVQDALNSSIAQMTQTVTEAAVKSVKEAMKGVPATGTSDVSTAFGADSKKELTDMITAAVEAVMQKEFEKASNEEGADGDVQMQDATTSHKQSHGMAGGGMSTGPVFDEWGEEIVLLDEDTERFGPERENLQIDATRLHYLDRAKKTQIRYTAQLQRGDYDANTALLPAQRDPVNRRIQPTGDDFADQLEMSLYSHNFTAHHPIIPNFEVIRTPSPVPTEEREPTPEPPKPKWKNLREEAVPKPSKQLIYFNRLQMDGWLRIPKHCQKPAPSIKEHFTIEGGIQNFPGIFEYNEEAEEFPLMWRTKKERHGIVCKWTAEHLGFWSGIFYRPSLPGAAEQKRYKELGFPVLSRCGCVMQLPFPSVIEGDLSGPDEDGADLIWKVLKNQADVLSLIHGLAKFAVEG